MAPQAAAKRLTLTVGHCPPELAVRADDEKLRRILVNLLSNAVKFTDPSGLIDVTCMAWGGSVCIAISDTGIGIGSDKLEAIFEPFVQVNRGLTRTGAYREWFGKPPVTLADSGRIDIPANGYRVLVR